MLYFTVKFVIFYSYKYVIFLLTLITYRSSTFAIPNLDFEVAHNIFLRITLLLLFSFSFIKNTINMQTTKINRGTLFDSEAYYSLNNFVDQPYLINHYMYEHCMTAKFKETLTKHPCFNYIS